jgi:plastocyanin
MKFKFPSYSLFIALFLSCALAVSSCHKKSDDDFGDDDDDQGGSAPAMTVDPATAGSITGKVVFDGAAPAPKVANVESDPVCKAAASTEKPDVTQDVAVTDGKLANVFVYISEGINGSFTPPTDPVVINQQGCRYHPHVLGVMVGQKVQFKNSDPTLHNIHPTPTKNAAFNLAQATQGKVDEKTFDKEEVMIPVSCDVHGWMRSYIGVLPHPFYAVSSDDGSFTLKGVPPGKYTITAWHETLGTQTTQVELKPKETKDISFTFKAK